MGTAPVVNPSVRFICCCIARQGNRAALLVFVTDYVGAVTEKVPSSFEGGLPVSDRTVVRELAAQSVVNAVWEASRLLTRSCLVV